MERFISRYYFHRRNLRRARSPAELNQVQPSVLILARAWVQVREQLDRSVADCVRGREAECSYSGILSRGDLTDSGVVDLHSMDLARMK